MRRRKVFTSLLKPSHLSTQRISEQETQREDKCGQEQNKTETAKREECRSEEKDVKNPRVKKKDVQFITVMFHYVCIELNE